ACMAAAIRDELRQTAGSVLVVTGGFHTVALPDLVAADTPRPEPLSLSADEAGTWLMRYSFDQLDALAGYASGMPSPAFYDRLWEASSKRGHSSFRPAETKQHSPEPEGRKDECPLLDDAFAHVAADIIVEIGRLTRERNFPVAISTPDAIAAVQMTRQLARLRGHPWPLREDVLDGMRSCFVKGTMDAEGRVLLRLVH